MQMSGMRNARECALAETPVAVLSPCIDFAHCVNSVTDTVSCVVTTVGCVVHAVVDVTEANAFDTLPHLRWTHCRIRDRVCVHISITGGLH